MRKSTLILFSFTFVFGLFVFFPKELEASTVEVSSIEDSSVELSSTIGWAEWVSVPKAGSNCKVRMGTDASTYYKGATTVDYQIQNNGKCSTLYYKAFITNKSGNHYGYFSRNSPVKSFKISTFTTPGGGPYHLTMNGNLYTNSARTNYAGLVTKSVTIHR